MRMGEQPEAPGLMEAQINAIRKYAHAAGDLYSKLQDYLKAADCYLKAGQTINIVHSPPTLACEKRAGSEDVASSLSSYKLSDTLQGDPKANPYLESGDIVTLPDADQVYVVGNVFTPLTIPLKEPITLSRAIAMAGGVRQDSNKNKVRIVRQEAGSSKKQEMVVDLSAIEKRRAEDIALQPNDIIDVPTSGGKSLLRSLLGGSAQTLTQLPIRIIP